VAQKVAYPDRIFMLRGNHEVKDVNGDFEVYGTSSFLYQCMSPSLRFYSQFFLFFDGEEIPFDRDASSRPAGNEIFGEEKGTRLWEAFNLVFDQLPIAAVRFSRALSLSLATCLLHLTILRALVRMYL
jgi:hypothetical protein